MINEKPGSANYGKEIPESAEEKAQAMVAQELNKLGWAESELSQRRKKGAEKIKMGLPQRREATMTLPWIAQRLYMGTRTHLSRRDRGYSIRLECGVFSRPSCPKSCSPHGS